MSRSKKAVAVAAFVTLLAVAATAGATRFGTSAPPDAASLGLGPSDVPHSRVAYQGLLPGADYPVYWTMLVPTDSPSRPIVSSEVLLGDNAAHADAVMGVLADEVRTPAGRIAVGKEVARDATRFWRSAAVRNLFRVTGNLRFSKVVVGAPSSPAKDVLVVPHKIVVSGQTFRVSVAYIRVDRAIVELEIWSKGSAGAAALKRLIAVARGRLLAGFKVANTMPPAITGIPIAGYPLNADIGNWTGGASDFTYAWQRCGTDGSACVPIDGATGSTYVVSTADAGSAIKVAVHGSNAVSASDATSGQVAVLSF